MSDLSDERFDVLRAVPLFEAFSESELAAVSGAAKERRFDTGDLIVGEAEAGVGFFVVTEGEARVELHGERVGTLGPGASFGDSALLDEEPARAFTVVAEAPMAVLGITPWQFSPLLEQHPEMALKLAKALARRVRALEERVTASW
jgi:CRP/FNR family cyclic AMP-dependent transcriptional regulator